MRRRWGVGTIVASAVLVAACVSGAELPKNDAADAFVARPAAHSSAKAGEDSVLVTGAAVDRGRTSLADFLRVISERSCLHEGRAAAESISLTVEPVPLHQPRPGRNIAGELDFVAGFQLSSPDRRFGGLSGIEVLDNGDLLAISDAGRFVWIDVASDGATPVRAALSAMHGLNGEVLSGAEGDAEGLAVNVGTALVSFEGNHRVLAFDVGRCGAAARGAPIVFGPYGLPLPNAFANANLPVSDEDGAKPLAVTNDWYLFTGVETRVGSLSTLSVQPIESDPDFSMRVGVEAPQFVALDVLPALSGGGGVRAFMLHRSFNSEKDATVKIMETDYNRYTGVQDNSGWAAGELRDRARQRFAETGWRELQKLDEFTTVENFEGIAAKEMPDGRVRLFIISDDSFSARQRTLLMVFDVRKPLR